jgi:hypothetical protein
MPDVRSKSGTPIAGDFASAKGTPLVVDTSTGNCYVMTDDEEVFNINGTAHNVKGFGATGDGSTDDTDAIQDAIDACSEGGTVFFPYGDYKYTTLTISKTITLLGVGWHTSVQAAFGNAGYATGVLGSVLRSTTTSGTNTIVCQTTGKAPRFEKLAIVGPGSGTSTAIAFGSSTNYQVWGRWCDVFIANFYQGVVLTNVEDWTFDSLRLRGISTNALLLQDGGVADPNTNQNVFINYEAQYCGTGIKFTEAITNRFVGGLLQNNTRDIIFKASLLGSVTNTSFDGVWFEGTSTPPIEWDLTDGGPICTQFSNCHMSGSGDAWTVTGTGSRVISLTLAGNHWQSRDVNCTASRFDNVLPFNNRFNSYTDSAGLLTFGGTVRHPILATADLPAAAAAMNGSIIIEDAGAGDRNLIVYAGGQRFRIDGGANF